MTAFTARWLGLGMGTARRDADVPAGVVRGALQWLAARQQPDGHWTEAGTLIAEDALQQSPLVLTATTLFTFLDTKVNNMIPISISPLRIVTFVVISLNSVS